MKAVVTGVAGFIGSHLAARLLADGYEVVGVDSFSDYYSPALKRDNVRLLTHPCFTLVEGDLNEIQLMPILTGCSVVFHQAGQPGVRTSWGAEFDVYVQANIMATQRLLETARTMDSLNRFVYASSSSVYGESQDFPVHEEQAPQPMSPYGVSKLAAEHLCTLYGRNFGVPTTSLRYFTVYGPRQRPDMAFTRFAQAFASGGEIEIYGDGKQIRDFSYVDDVVDANLAAAAGTEEPGAVYNVAGGSSISVNEVLDVFRDLSPVRPRISYRPSAIGDVQRTGGSTQRIRDSLAWSPAVTLHEGIARQFTWASSLVS